MYSYYLSVQKKSLVGFLSDDMGTFFTSFNPDYKRWTPQNEKKSSLLLIEYPAAAAAVLYCWKWPQLGPVNKGEGGACYLAAAAIDPKWEGIDADHINVNRCMV